MPTANLESPGAADWFAVNLVAGTTYSFTETGLTAAAQVFVTPAAGAADSSLQIDAGLAGQFPTGQTQGVTYTALASGLYYVEVSDLTAGTGAYELTAQTVTDSYTLVNPGVLGVGGTTNASLESVGGTDWFKVNLTAGTTYAFTETGLTGQTSLVVMSAADAAAVGSPAGVAMAGTSPTGLTQQATFTADATGAYYIEINDLTGATGAFTLGAATVANSYTLAHPGALAIGGSVNAQMESVGDTDWFKVTLAAGTTYTFTETGLTSQASVFVLPSSAADSSTLIDAGVVGSFANGQTQYATFTADTAGVYYVQVNDPGGSTASYTLGAAIVANSYTLASPGTLTVGAAARSASLQSLGNTDWFRVNLTAGTTYVFTESGLTAEASLNIVPAAGAADVSQLISGAVVGAFSTGAARQATFTADTTGAYYVQVSDFTTAGAFTLGATVATDSYTLAAPGALTVGGSATSASMQALGATDWFRVTLTAGTTYAFTETGLSAQATIAVASGSAAADTPFVIDPSQAASPGFGLSQTATFTADSTGVYYVEIRDPTATGAFTLSASVVSDSYTLAHPGALAVSNSFSASESFNGSGKSDFLIENGVGAVVVGEVTNGVATYAQVTGLGPEWSFKGAGDFFGDGHQGFLIQNNVGAVVVGELAGGQVNFTQIGGLGPEWTFKGVGDFYGDGATDFLIQNSNGAVVVGEVHGGQATYAQVTGLGPEWKFVAVGDFLGDGKSDFLIENSVGAVVAGEVNGGQTTFTNITGLGPEWSFRGAGDYLGEGHDQFLIENTTGSVCVGDYVNGQTQFTQLGGLGPEWKFVGTGDYLGEGHDQFLIENTTSGAVVVSDWTGGQLHFTQVGGLGSDWVFH